MLQCYSVTVLQCCSVTVLQCYSVTVLQCYSVAVLQCYSVTVLQQTYLEVASPIMLPVFFILLAKLEKEKLLSSPIFPVVSAGPGIEGFS